MKIIKKIKSISLILLALMIVMMSTPTISMAATSPIVKVNLGTTVNFAVLAGQTVTNTGPTVISGTAPEGGGNVGVYPGSAFPGQTQVSMTGWTAHLGDNIARDAQADLTIAYLDAAGRTPTTTFTENDNQLGGKTLKSGVYAFGHAQTANITAASPLILDAENNEEAVFIFQASSDFIMASGSEIRLINGAKFCRVFWQVTSSATLGTGSHFVGHIFALTSIWAQNGATVQGQLLARNGEVTLDNNTITNSLCVTPVSISSSSSSSSSTSINNTLNPNTGNSSSNTILFLFILITVSFVGFFVIRKKLANNINK